MDAEVAKLLELPKLENFNEIIHLCFQEWHSLTYEEKFVAIAKLAKKDGFLNEMLKKRK